MGKFKSQFADGNDLRKSNDIYNHLQSLPYILNVNMVHLLASYNSSNLSTSLGQWHDWPFDVFRFDFRVSAVPGTILNFCSLNNFFSTDRLPIFTFQEATVDDGEFVEEDNQEEETA